MDEGIEKNGFILNYVRYADDNLIFANTTQGLQNLMDNITAVSE